MKGKLILESFSPSLERVEFYYKPSKDWNYVVFSDFKYTDYFIRVYGNIPERVNPVKLSLIGDGGILFEDFKVDLPGDYLSGIIEKGGECSFKVEDDGIYLKGQKLEKCL